MWSEILRSGSSTEDLHLYRKFELLGIPRQHAVAAINFDIGEIHNYVDSVYKIENYILGYSFSVYPMPLIDYWEETGQ